MSDHDPHGAKAQVGWDPTVIAHNDGIQARLDALERDNARLTEAVMARDSFLAVAAHELRNPMTPILGRVTMLRLSIARGMPVDEIAERLDGIERLVTQFIKRATTLLDVSRIASERLDIPCVPVDVVRVATAVVENFRPAATHAGGGLAFDAPVDHPVVALADSLALEQVLENLISNAIKYGEGTPMSVSVGIDGERRRAFVYVRDDGPGIPHAHQARIFERFERAVAPGSEATGYGVGLWVVRNLCEAMGGSIDVISVLGEGATFRVSLPLAHDKDSL